jgi:glycosyltransferase involved in cell wall biosynthesis
MCMVIKVVTIVSRMNLGGVAVLLNDLHKTLNDKEFSHTLITGMCAENELDILDNQEEVKNIIKLQTMGRAPSLVADFKTFFKLRKILINLSPDIVHTHTSKAGVLGRLAALSIRKNITIVHTYHGHTLYGYFSKVIVKANIIIERILALKTDLFIADSVQVMIDLKKVRIGAKCDWIVIPPGIRPLKKISKKVARQKIGVDNKLFLICWIGRFADIKNPLLALKSFNNLPKNFKNRAELVMVGEGILLQDCKNYASRRKLNVIFPGWDLDISPYLAASDLLLVSSKNEGFGMVIAEAGFFKVPAISTNVGGVGEFIENKSNGILAKSSPEEISKKILFLSDNPEERNKLGLNANKTTLQKFTIDSFIQAHKAAYKNILA